MDRADGPLARFRNARLRAAWLRVAENLINCNAHYRGKSQFWKQQGVDPRDIRCRVANRASRTSSKWSAAGDCTVIPSRLDRGTC